MEPFLLAAGFALLDVLAIARLVELLQWPLTEAVVGPGTAGLVFTGQTVPISFATRDGDRVETGLRRWDKSAPPPAGATLMVRYRPAEPKQVEGAGAVAFLGLVVLILTAGFAVMGFNAIQPIFTD